jgi:riboflavin kinase/FMN adenylyltransferase
VTLNGELHDGVASVRTRLAADGAEPLLEVFIFDFDQAIYGEHITVHFIHRLRDEEKSAGIDAITAQMRQALIDARAVLAA